MYDGAVTLSYVEDNADYEGTIELSESMEVGKKITITIQGNSYSGIVETDPEFGTWVTCRDGELNDLLFLEDGTGSFISWLSTITEAGSYDIKVEQGDFDYTTTVYEGEIELAAHIPDYYGEVTPTTSPTLYAYTNLLVDDSDKGTAGWNGENNTVFSDDYVAKEVDGDIRLSAGDGGSHSIVIRQDTTVFNE